MMANYVLEGIYFYSVVLCFSIICPEMEKCLDLLRKSVILIRDENTHLWLFRNMILQLQRGRTGTFYERIMIQAYKGNADGRVWRQEIAWGHYVFGDDIPGISISK